MKERLNLPAPTANFEFEALRVAVNYRRALVREFRRHLRGRVIEIGAGVGQITELMRQLPDIRHLLAIEPDAGFCREFRNSFPGQPLIEGTIHAIGGDETWNAIVSINVLEHIREDERELADYRKLLQREKGRLCLFVPACQEIYAPIDGDFGHHRRYSKAELRSKLLNAGFDILRLDYFNCVGYFAWWLNFCVRKKRHFDIHLVRLFDRVIFPCVYALESGLFAPPFGQSLIAIAQARPT